MIAPPQGVKGNQVPTSTYRSPASSPTEDSKSPPTSPRRISPSPNFPHIPSYEEHAAQCRCAPSSDQPEEGGVAAHRRDERGGPAARNKSLSEPRHQGILKWRDLLERRMVMNGRLGPKVRRGEKELSSGDRPDINATQRKLSSADDTKSKLETHLASFLNDLSPSKGGRQSTSHPCPSPYIIRISFSVPPLRSHFPEISRLLPSSPPQL